METDYVALDAENVTLGLHWMLLRLAGSLPDDLLTHCRYWLAGGRRSEIARSVTHAVLAQRRTLTEADLGLLGELLVEAGADASAVTLIDVDDFDGLPRHGFVPGRSGLERVPGGQDPGEEPTLAEQARAAQPEDDVDLALIRALDPAHARAAWRAWRYPADGAPWPVPRRVYVVETDRRADAPRLAAVLASVLAAAGELSPQVEVYPIGAEVPTYQRLARAYGALIWSADPDPGVRIASLFDGVDAETGPTMNPDHPVATEDERLRLLEYLRRGEPLLVTTALMDDVVEPSRGAAVPMNFVTDGCWVWTDAITYYLERYRLLPEPELLAHIRDREYRFTEVDGAGVHRALAALQEPMTEDPSWTYG